MSAWIQHVKATQQKHKCSYKDAMIKAKSTYQRGGALPTDTLRKVLDNSYTQTRDDIDGYKVDKSLSGKRAQVYVNADGKAIVSHRGTSGLHDVLTDMKYVMGQLGTTKRLKHARRIQKEAEAKYGSQNTTTVGHSLGSVLAQKVGRNSAEIITMNKPVGIWDMRRKIRDIQTDIRTTRDPVSFLRPFQKGAKALEIQSHSFSPLVEHSYNTLSRLTQLWRQQVGI